MTSPHPIRFFFTLVRPSWVLFAAAVLIVGFGAFLARYDPEGFDQAPAIALFLQMFAASTGYREPLREGHFDGVLVGRRYRADVALAHCLASSALGLATWLALAALDVLAAHPGRPPTATTPAGLAAIWYVSTAAWAISLPLSRYATGTLWVVSLLGVAATHHLVQLREGLLHVDGSWIGALRAVAGALVCPVFLVGDAGSQGVRVLMLVALVGTMALAVGSLCVAVWDAAMADRS
jgi:hypothetical protein